MPDKTNPLDYSSIPENLRKQEVRDKQTELKLKRERNKQLEKEIKQNKSALEKQNKLELATEKQKKTHLKSLKKEFELQQNRKTLEQKLATEKNIIEKQALNDLRKERVLTKKFIKRGEMDEIRNIRQSSSQKKFYENIIKRQEAMQGKASAKETLRKEKILTKGTPSTAGILGGMIGGKLKETISELPIISSVLGIVKSVKEAKGKFADEQAEIARDKLGAFGDDSSPMGGGGGAMGGGGGEGNDLSAEYLNLLIDTNKEGFQDVVSTLLSIDRGEDTEEEEEKRDAERNKEDEVGMIGEAVKEEKEESGTPELLQTLGLVASGVAGLAAVFTNPEIQKKIFGFITGKDMDVHQSKSQDVLDQYEGKPIRRTLKRADMMLKTLNMALGGAEYDPHSEIAPTVFDTDTGETTTPVKILPNSGLDTENKSDKMSDWEIRMAEWEKGGKKGEQPSMFDKMHSGGEVTRTLQIGEYVLDNQASKMFLEASKNMGTGGEMVKVLYEINKNILEMNKKAMGNVIVQHNNVGGKSIDNAPTQLTYAPSNNLN